MASCLRVPTGFDTRLTLDRESATSGPWRATKTDQLPATARHVSQPSAMEECTAQPHVPACMRRVPTEMPTRPQQPPPSAPAAAEQVPPCMRRTTMPDLYKGAEHQRDSTTCFLDFTDCPATPGRRVHFDMTLQSRPPPKRPPDPVWDQVLAARAVRAKTAAAEAAQAQTCTTAVTITAEDDAILGPIISQRWHVIGTRRPPASPSTGAALRSGRRRTPGSTRQPSPTSSLSLALSSSWEARRQWGKCRVRANE